MNMSIDFFSLSSFNKRNQRGKQNALSYALSAFGYSLSLEWIFFYIRGVHCLIFRPLGNDLCNRNVYSYEGLGQGQSKDSPLFVEYEIHTCHSFRFYLNHSDFFLKFSEIQIT